MRGPAALFAAVAVLTVAVLTGAAGCAAPQPGTTDDVRRSDDAAVVAQALSGLTVVDRRVHVLGYSREHFGGWISYFHEHPAGSGMCSTREIVLLETFAPSPGAGHDTEHADDDESGYGNSPVGSCPAASGTATDIYSGEEIVPQDVEIDHVIPLAVAWDHGANEWPRERRIRFANDRELNLLAVSGVQNQRKSDASLGEWLPPRAGTACAYAARYLSVAVRYSLTITGDDKEAAGDACGL
ncbi:MAG TPA: HNH endonuclease family protein [Candidatus Corynebacterium faecigallinarum]|uniref:HNH endonuclease family protein n=1 Tax=Candidatus Corynebacterium faecigallinarum TaxID=2838528 RepID=A0A9D2TNW7_9CORY|nr:HNH endonuclease family protein [Candidatus Corynebacterium faecigallinarum]